MADHENRRQSTPSRRRRILLAFLLLAAAAYLVVPLLSRASWVRSRVERAAEQFSGQEIEIGRLALGYDLALRVFSLSVSDADRPAFLMAERITVSLSPAGMLRGQPIGLELHQPRIFIENLPKSDGKRSAPSAGSKGESEVSLPIYSLVIEDGYIVTSTQGGEIGPVTASIDAIRAQQEGVVSVEIDPGLPPLEIAATVAGAEASLPLAVVRLSWRGVSLAALAERFPQIAGGAKLQGTLDLSGTASGSGDSLTGSGSLTIARFRYHTDAFEVAGDLEAPLLLQGTAVEFKDGGIHLAGPTFSFAGVNGGASQAAVTGSVALDGDRVRAHGDLQIAEVQAHDPTYERVIENAKVTGILEATWDPGTQPVLGVNLNVSGGELLWDRFYADIGLHPVRLAGEIRASPAIELSRIDARADGIGRITGEARLRPPDTIERLVARIDVGNLESLYALAVRDPYKESFSFLATSSVGGKLGGRIEYTSAGETFSLTGDVSLTDVWATADEAGFELRGLNLRLPLRLGRVEPAEERGALGVAGLRIGDIIFGGFDAELAARPNVVELRRPVAVALFNGALRLTHLMAEQLDSEQPRVTFGMAMDGVDLDALTTAMSLPPLQGNLSGAIPSITATGGEVRSEGEIRIQAFNGNVAIRNVSVDQLFSSVPTLRLDLDFEEISLGEVTEAFEVGRITGVARGGASNLAIVNGQPLSFDAWMETVERSGVSQRISVSAIRQLSILGGSGGDPFSQGILGLFDEYRYAEMGFRCRLENDRFLLRGVETIDGKEYLVVGSFMPPRVNVVSHNTVISFSEMVSRLQRIGATSEEGEGGNP